MALSTEARGRWRQRFMRHFLPAVRLPKDIDLSRLTDSERAELLALLEQRVGGDGSGRPPLVELWVNAVLDNAAAADNSEGYLAVSFGHEQAKARHMARLTADRSATDSIPAFVAAFAADSTEAERLAIEDGYLLPVAERAAPELRETTPSPRVWFEPQRQLPAPPKPEPVERAPWLRSIME